MFLTVCKLCSHGEPSIWYDQDTQNKRIRDRPEGSMLAGERSGAKWGREEQTGREPLRATLSPPARLLQLRAQPLPKPRGLTTADPLRGQANDEMKATLRLSH